MSMSPLGRGRNTLESPLDSLSLHSDHLSFLISFKSSQISNFDQRSLLNTRFETADKCTKIALLTLVYDCIEEFRVLSQIYTATAPSFVTTDVTYEPLEERFGQTRLYGHQRLGQVYTDVHKLQKTVSLILFLLEKLAEEVKKYGTCSLFLQYTENMLRMKEDEDNLIYKIKNKFYEIDRLRRAYLRYRDRKSVMDVTFDDVLARVYISVANEIESSKIGVSYLTNWQEARYEQNLIKLRNKETHFITISNSMQRKYLMEERCHYEMLAYLDETDTDYREQIQNAMEDYEATVEIKDQELFSIKLQMEKQKDKMESIKLIMDERSFQMEEWLEYRRQQKIAALLKLGQIRFIMKIQAWWRKVMIQHKLGPYKKKQKKNKKGKKGRK